MNRLPNSGFISGFASGLYCTVSPGSYGVNRVLLIPADLNLADSVVSVVSETPGTIAFEACGEAGCIFEEVC